MAAGQSDYRHGEMPVTQHKHTFSGFMSGTKYGGSLLALIILMPTLVFSTALTWFPSLVITVVVGILLGLGLKMKGGWYAAVIGLAIFTAIISVLLSALT